MRFSGYRWRWNYFIIINIIWQLNVYTYYQLSFGFFSLLPRVLLARLDLLHSRRNLLAGAIGKYIIHTLYLMPPLMNWCCFHLWRNFLHVCGSCTAYRQLRAEDLYKYLQLLVFKKYLYFGVYFSKEILVLKWIWICDHNANIRDHVEVGLCGSLDAYPLRPEGERH